MELRDKRYRVKPALHLRLATCQNNIAMLLLEILAHSGTNNARLRLSEAETFINLMIGIVHGWLSREGLIDFNEAVFTINNIGDNKVFATVVRKNDGATGVVTCLDIFISCDEYSCLSDVDKKIYKLQTIINEVDSWYNDDYPNLSPVDRCYISESIIRALEYEYTLMGGTNLPVFSKTADCANSVSPQAYKYKIQLLIDTI